MTFKFDTLCPYCGHLAHLQSAGDQQLAVSWCDGCNATGFKRIRIGGIVTSLLLLFGGFK